MDVYEATRPVARIALLADDEQYPCDRVGCENSADVVITFTGQIALPHHRCAEDWPSARSTIVDAGYKTDYTADAADFLARRYGGMSSGGG
jgi:hypothetical protein